MQVRRHTILIFKEAMHNILKHARAKRAELTYQMDGNDIVIRLSDDGVGLNSTRPMDGLGLRSMHRRAGEIKGQLQISRDPTGGTLVSLKLDRTKITNGVFL
jgi:signal transduction histidine kinase